MKKALKLFWQNLFCRHSFYLFIEFAKIQEEKVYEVRCDKCGKHSQTTLFLESATNEHRRVQLCKKNTYRSKKVAETVLNTCLKRKRKNQPTRIYKCEKCQGYHLTHKTKNTELYETIIT